MTPKEYQTHVHANIRLQMDLQTHQSKLISERIKQLSAMVDVETKRLELDQLRWKYKQIRLLNWELRKRKREIKYRARRLKMGYNRYIYSGDTQMLMALGYSGGPVQDFIHQLASQDEEKTNQLHKQLLEIVA